MEGRHRQETRELKKELEEMNSEHEIELEMLRKEMEDLKLREERWKRVAELKKESDYDSSDVGSRDHSPEVEALKEQMAALQSNYEDEITVLKEKLQTQIMKASEAVEKVENQEFEFQESLSELKIAFEQEKKALLRAHQEEIDELNSKKTNHIEISHNVSMDASQKEHYENQIQQLQDQVANLSSQLEESDNQMAQDLLIMKNEFETQLEEAKGEFDSEKEVLKKTITELKTQAEDVITKHHEDIEQLEQAFKREKEELLVSSQSHEDQVIAGKAMHKKLEEYEIEIRELKENLQKERNEFIESRELLEGMLSEQEKESEEREEKLRDELNEEHQMKVDKVVSDYEQRLQAAERSHIEGKELDEEKRTSEELRLEIKSIKRGHERELEKLYETLETLQSENENLKREFDLVVGDLSSELETTKNDGNQGVKRKTSHVLREQIEIIKGNQEEQIRLLGEDIEWYKQKVAELEGEVERLRGVEGRTEADTDLHTRTAELEYELDVLREESQNTEAELEEYKTKVSDLERQLTRSKNTLEQNSEQEERLQKISGLEKQLEGAIEAKMNSEAKLEEYKTTAENLQKEITELSQTNKKLASEVMNYELQLQNLNEELKTTKERSIDEFTTMQDTIAKLEAEKRNLENTMEKQLKEGEMKMSKLRESIEKEKEDKVAAVDAHKKKSDEIILRLNENIKVLDADCQKYRKEKDALVQEIQQLRKRGLEDEEETSKKVSRYEETIKKLYAKTESLENYQTQSEIEKEDLREELQTLRYSQEIEPIVSAQAVNDNFAGNPGSNLGLEYEQQMKGLAEDYEEKIEKLQAELEAERSKSASNTRRIESTNYEIETLRQTLEEERLSVKNSQDRMIKMQERHDEEVKNLKEQLHVSEKDNEAKKLSNQEVVEKEFSKTIKTLEADLETTLQANNEKAEKLNDVKSQLEKAWHTNEAQEREITKLNYEIEEYRRQQKAKDASSTAEQLTAKEVHAKTVQVLKADLEAQRKLNEEQKNQINELKLELDTFKQQKLTHEANLTAEQLKVNEEHAKTVVGLKAELDTAHKLNETKQKEKEELKQMLEDFQQQQVAHEANLTAEQLKISEAQKSQKQELKKITKENAALKSQLESVQHTNRMQSEELSRSKFERDQLEKTQKQYEKNILAEHMKADEGSARKIKALEEEVKRKTEEMSKLFTVLDTEQKGRERVLLETEKHLTHMHQAEQEKIKSERVISDLKSHNNELRGELIKEKEKFSRYVSQSEKAQSEEHEEVEKLSRSLTESEMDKGKLTGEIETCKDELNKLQEKYNKLKEKFLALKQKHKEEKEKYDEVLLTPRIEMGLQTSLLEPDDLNQTKEQLCSSMKEQVRLEDELEILQRDINTKKSEIQALKRANEVLRRQNQVLYLETESLRKSGHREGVDLPSIEKENEKLIQDKENLEIENRFLKEALSEREKQEEESQEKESLSDNMTLKNQLRESKENQVRIEQENSKLREENDFLLKQGKRLQSQVDKLEEEVGRLKGRTPVTSTPKSNTQPPAFVSEFIRSETGNQLNVESLPESSLMASPSSSLEAQRYAEENQRIKEQLLVLQTRLRSKEHDVKIQNNLQPEAVQDLVNERQELLAQIESLKELLEKHDDKELNNNQTKANPKVSKDILFFLSAHFCN